MSLPEPFDALLALDPSSLRVAVVGASNDERKFGSIIMRAVLGRGSRALPVTPTSAEVHGISAARTLGEIAARVDVASFVVPPARALDALASLPEGAKLPIWFQPGSYDDAVLDAARARGVPVLAGPCILVEFDARR
jgi:predicted CoA-binding protein